MELMSTYNHEHERMFKTRRDVDEEQHYYVLLITVSFQNQRYKQVKFKMT
jgi:hypothetical protein